MKKVICTFLLLFPINVLAFGTSAKSSILMDMDSGRILYGKDIHYVQSVASISKIMTAICVIENIDVDKTITVGDEILKSYGSGIYIQQGEKIRIVDLLYGLMMRSGNDAALTLAVNTSGSVDKFTSLMNKMAFKLKMNNSVFNNPTGLDQSDDGNLSSSYDMALLMSYAMKNKLFRKIVSTKNYSLKTNKNVYKWKNKNKLLYSYKHVIGGKTGYTKRAKRTLVTSASKDGFNLVAVTINDGNDFRDHEHLFKEAFDNYHNYVLLKKGTIVVPGENYYDGRLYIKRNVVYPLTVDEEKILKIKYEIKKIRKYANKIRIGVVKVYLGDEIIRKEKIYYEGKNGK